MRCSSSLPPVLTTVRDDEGSSRITDAASSIHAHRDHHGQGGDVQPARNSASAHSVPTHTLSVPTEQSGVGQGGDDHSAYSSILAQRIAASFPTYYGGTPVTTDLGCNGWTTADFWGVTIGPPPNFHWCFTGGAGIEARFHIESTMVWLIYGEIWDGPTNGKPRY